MLEKEVDIHKQRINFSTLCSFPIFPSLLTKTNKHLSSFSYYRALNGAETRVDREGAIKAKITLKN